MLIVGSLEETTGTPPGLQIQLQLSAGEIRALSRLPSAQQLTALGSKVTGYRTNNHFLPQINSGARICCQTLTSSDQQEVILVIGIRYRA